MNDITLKTLSSATEQQVFDQVAAHLIKQHARSINSKYNTCAYRESGGKKCAAGCLISDGEYKVEMEGRTWAELLCEGLVPVWHADLIERLQEVHDISNDVEWCSTIHDRLRDVADEFSVDSSVLWEE